MDAPSRRPPLSWPMQTLLGLAGTAALVTVAYFFLDGPALAFIRGYRLDRYPLLKWLTRPPEAFILVSLFVLPACLLRRWFGPWTWGEKAAAAAAVATLLTAAAVGLLKMAFGRCGDGFRPFDFAAPYWAFPSGHTACTLSATVVAQAALPRWRWCWWSVAGVVAAMLIALGHHCLGDVLGGAFVGWAIGGTAARSFGVRPANE